MEATATTLQLQYPLPPAHYSRFTDAALAENPPTDPFLRPPPPLGATVAAYTVFGETHRLQDRAPRLSEMNIRQLFPDETVEGFDHAYELKRLNHSLLLNFMELQDILVTQPEQFAYKIDDIRLIFVNMHHLLNMYRPHQARDTLKLLYELQIKRKKNTVADLAGCIREVQETLRRELQVVDSAMETAFAGVNNSEVYTGQTDSEVATAMDVEEKRVADEAPNEKKMRRGRMEEFALSL